MTEDLAKIGRTIHQETRKSRKQIYVFLFCLVLSSVLWLFSKLSKEISLSLSFPVEFINIPENMTLTGSSIREIQLEFNEKAAALLILKHVAPRSTLEIDLADVTVDKNGESYSAILDLSTVHYDLNQREILPFRILSVTPDTLVLTFTQKGGYDVKENNLQHHDGIK